jgi:hypothetical protein
MKVVNIANNQQSVESNGEIKFFSYGTEICTITNYENGNELIIKIVPGQPQSKTTAKYLNEFLKLHTNFDNYKQIK